MQFWNRKTWNFRCHLLLSLFASMINYDQCHIYTATCKTDELAKVLLFLQVCMSAWLLNSITSISTADYFIIDEIHGCPNNSLLLIHPWSYHRYFYAKISTEAGIFQDEPYIVSYHLFKILINQLINQLFCSWVMGIIKLRNVKIRS